MKALALFILALCVAAMHAQGLPVPVTPLHVTYPPIGRAAHVSGDVEVRFSIADDGSVEEIRKGSGPEMLAVSLMQQMKDWRFATPLPMGAARAWTARVSFRMDRDEDNLEDAVDGPPWYPCCGDMIRIDPSAIQVSGGLTDDRGGAIPISPAFPVEPCPAGQKSAPPAEIGRDDYVELDRRERYRLRVYRWGRVEWHGDEKAGVVVTGDRQFSVPSATADALLRKFAEPAFWQMCGAPLPPQFDRDGEVVYGEFLTAHIGPQAKTIRLAGGAADKYAWAVDTATNSHAWRHGNAIGEPFRNMVNDLRTPKQGVTALMRAVDHYNPTKAEWTDAALKYQLARNPDLEATDESGWTALMYAAGLRGSCCDDAAVRMLIAAGAVVNHASTHGDTPLMAVAYDGDLSETLLKAGAKINARNGDGVTVLMLLAQKPDADTIAEALQAGADASAQDSKGRTAADYLREASCNRAIVSLPVPFVQIVYEKPKPCPVRTKEYLESEALLKSAMKKTIR